MATNTLSLSSKPLTPIITVSSSKQQSATTTSDTDMEPSSIIPIPTAPSIIDLHYIRSYPYFKLQYFLEWQRGCQIGQRGRLILIQYKYYINTSHMSTAPVKQQKVTLEEGKAGKAGFENAPKLFSKWSYDDIKITDPCFIDYIAAASTKAQVFVPHTAGRYQAKKFRKALCPIVERLVGSLQFHGRNTGKKVKAIRIVRHAFEIIHLLTGRNPLEVFVNAIVQAGPREDSTRIGAGGVVRKQAVDVSPLRRVNQAIYLITQGVREHAFRSLKTIAEVLADEIINVEKGNMQSSYALKKKEEIEKVAKGNR